MAERRAELNRIFTLVHSSSMLHRLALDVLSFEFNISSMSTQNHDNSLPELFQVNFPAHGEGDESYIINTDNFQVLPHQRVGWKCLTTNPIVKTTI